MNLLRLKYALEVAKAGSLNKAAHNLLIAAPNISRSIKELEFELGITIFERTTTGMQLTPEGEELMGYAQNVFDQLEQIENFYKKGTPKKLKFAVSVPRASYISEAFANFSNTLSEEPFEFFYKETNSLDTIRNIIDHNYDLGIVRYSENNDGYFKSTFEEKNLCYEYITEFSYRVLISKDHPLAESKEIYLNDLIPFTEITHADTFIPPAAASYKEDLTKSAKNRIFVFERGSQFELLSQNTDTYMWVSPIPHTLLDAYGLTEKKCTDNDKVYKDVLIYKNRRKLTKLDNCFITELCNSKRKYL